MAHSLEDEGEIKSALSPWSYSLFTSLPHFFQHQILIYREIEGSIKLSQLETERLVAYLVSEELEKRKKNGTYSGTFAPVTHFFGYQGRSAHPSHFDCSLGSTCGFAAARLIEAGLTATAVSVKQISQPPEEWRVGGVPIMALLSSYPKEGFERHKLVVRANQVNIKSAPFQEYKRQVKSWMT